MVWLIFTSRIIIGIVLLLAGFFKLRFGYHWFQETIRSYSLVKDRWVSILAYVLPPFEISCGLLLLFGVMIKPTSILVFVLLTAFTLATLIVVFRGRNIHCGCFGRQSLTEHSRWTIIKRNLILMLMSIFLIGWSTSQGNLTHSFRPIVSLHSDLFLFLGVWLTLIIFSLVLLVLQISNFEG